MVKLIEGYIHHTIDVNGCIVNTETGKTKNVWISKIGYPCVSISEGGFSKTEYVHRLLAKAFIDNPEDKKQVNHIDGNKANNNINNLEWVTPSENILHAYATKLQPYRRKYTLEEYENLLGDFLSGKSLTYISTKTNQGLTQLSYHIREAATRLGKIQDYEIELLNQKTKRSKQNGKNRRDNINLQMLHKDSGDIIKTFTCLVEAVEYLKVKSAGPISNVLKGRQKSAYGYFWVKS